MQRVVVGDFERSSGVERWRGRVAPSSAALYCRYLRRFCFWAGKTPEELLAWARGAKDPFEVLDRVQAFVNEVPGPRRNTRQSAYAALRSFFMHNRVNLPRDPSFRVKAVEPPIRRQLTIENLREIIGLATQPYRSMILAKWMGVLDHQGLMYVNLNCATAIVEAVRRGKELVRLDLPGRKSLRNERPFYSFIGGDALSCLKEYFERSRGWPEAGEPVWVYEHTRKPVTLTAFSFAWLRLVRRAGLIKTPDRTNSSRYGYGGHNTRDLAISLLNTIPGFNPLCAEFFAGHNIDPLGYNQFYNVKPDYVEAQYRLALPHLNIVSNWNPEAMSNLAKENEELRERMARLEGQFETILKTRFGQQD